MSKLIQAFLCFILVLFASEAHAAFTVTGRVSYNRNWSGNEYGSTSDIPSAQRTGVHRLKDVQVCVTPQAGGGTTCGWTNSNGDYSFAVPTAAGTYARRIYFAGQSLVTPGQQGFRVVATSADTAPLNYNMTTFVAPSSGTINLSNHTLPVCTPATSTCPNDFANGHQVVQWAVSRLISTYQMNTISEWNAAADKLRAYTDRTFNLSCATGGTTFCFNFDFGSTRINDGWHELGHSLLRLHGTLLGYGGFGNFPGQGECASPEEDSGGEAVDEGVANLNAVLMGYGENAAGTLSNLDGFCFSTDEPVNDNSMNCVSCEYSPNPNVYPQPSQVCGTSGDFAIQRTECRVLKIYINLLDSQSNNISCINESINLTYKQLWQVIASVPGGATNCSGCTQETALGERGNAIGSQDAFSVMDILRDLRTIYGLPASELYKVWANACYLPGETSWAINEFLPSSQQGTPFP